MPACKMKFNAKGGGRGKSIGMCMSGIAPDGREFDRDHFHFGGSTYQAPKVEVAAPPVKAKVGGTKGGW